MSAVTIYHNPRCSKSRATLESLEERGLQPKIVEYLETPPTAAELRRLVEQLEIRPEQLVRKGEEIFQEKYAGKKLTDDQWIEAMIEHPALMERPIVLHGGKAVLGRPPENVHRLFK